MTDLPEIFVGNLHKLRENKKKPPSFIPEFSEDQVVLIKNPKNRVGPKHIFTKGGLKDVCECGWHPHGTTLKRVSDNADDCVEVVDKNDFDVDDEIICKNCVKSYTNGTL